MGMFIRKIGETGKARWERGMGCFRVGELKWLLAVCVYGVGGDGAGVEGSRVTLVR